MDDNIDLDFSDQANIYRYFYTTLCGSNEALVDRIMHPVKAEDWLLKFRAEPLLDNPRLFRVAVRRMQKYKLPDLLQEHFPDDFSSYVENMSDVGRIICECIPAGYVLTKDADAMCLDTDAGKIIVISEVVRFFLYFSSLASPHLFDIGSIPPDVQSSALIIAIRTMSLVEALDFDLDPRGQIPPETHQDVTNLVEWQMRFVIGHEYAHHRLGHKGTGVRRISAPKASPEGTMKSDWTVWNRSHDEEFEADIGAIEEIEDVEFQRGVVRGALAFFMNLLLFERVIENLDSDFAQLTSHPDTAERLRHMMKNFGNLIEVNTDWVERAIENQQHLASQLVTLFQNQPNLLKQYGSIYLGSWQGKMLADRIDY